MHVIEADELREAIAPLDLLEATRESFLALSAGRMRTTADTLDLDDGDVHVKAASEVGGEIYVVKLASLIPSNRERGLAPGGGGIVVCSALTGEPLALLVDDHYLTDARTAVAGALASDLLARPAASAVGVLGSGEQARLQVTTLAGLRKLDRVAVWARREEAAKATAASLRDELGATAEVTVAATARDAVEVAEILITATASLEPLIEAEWLRPGQQVTAVGADDHRKHELTSACFARASRIAVDLRAQTCAKAELAKALAEGAVDEDRIAEMGELLSGERAGRGGEEEITIAKLTGVAAQDLAAAKAVARKLALFG
jgi:ornithine cyclodeaminase/alanine dehydrogenase-like protein (mu-crystallin family)